MNAARDGHAASHRTWFHRGAYVVLRWLAQLAGICAFGMRAFGADNYPRHGGALICSNHQSHFDPVIVGMTCSRRRMNYVARKSLFRFPLFRWLIEFLDAIPLDRDGIGLAGVKETLRRLKRGEFVLIFPEGTRTRNGKVQPLKPGFCAIVRRISVPLVPVGFDGAHHAWPRHRRWPRLSRIVVVIGRPIEPAEFEHLDDRQLVELLQRRIENCFHIAKRLRHRSCNIRATECADPDPNDEERASGR